MRKLIFRKWTIKQKLSKEQYKFLLSLTILAGIRSAISSIKYNVYVCTLNNAQGQTFMTTISDYYSKRIGTVNGYIIYNYKDLINILTKYIITNEPI